MKKIIFCLFLLFCTIPLEATTTDYKVINAFELEPLYSGVTFSAVETGNRITNITQKVAFRFIPYNSINITGIDVWETHPCCGNLTGAIFNVSIWSDNATTHLPEARIGGYATWSGIAVNNFRGINALSSATGSLTPYEPYFIVVSVDQDSVNVINSSNSFIPVRSDSRHTAVERFWHYNGTGWTNSTAGELLSVFQLNDSSYYGYATISSAGTSGYPDIFNVSKQGIRCNFGSKVSIIGCQVAFTITGAPGNITARVYEENVEKYNSSVIPAFYVLNATGGGNGMYIMFNNVTELSANSNISIVFEQDGISDSNDYDFSCLTTNATYFSALNSNYKIIYGNGTNIINYTIDNTLKWAQFFKLYFTNLTTDFNQSATGGGGGSSGYSSPICAQ